MEGLLMLSTNTKYCNKCECETDTQVIKREAVHKFKGEVFTIDEKVLVCGKGHVLPDKELDSITLKRLADMYMERNDMSFNDIKDIRAYYGLSMQLFAKVLGWGKATIVRYETGKYIPTGIHLSTLRRLKEDPSEIWELYKFNKTKLTTKEQEKVESKLQKINSKGIEEHLNEAIISDYKKYEKSIESGYSSFSLNKIIHMILYFANKGVPKTKLMKLLFYADFLSYKRESVSISGVPYQRYPYGPVPMNYDLLLTTLERSEILNINTETISYNTKEYTLTTISANEEFEETLFDSEELQVLEDVNKFFEEFGSGDIADFSHNEEGWLNTSDRDVISYDYADCLKLD